jgi:ABC-type uncharacterized transport system auxiliary subunit
MRAALSMLLLTAAALVLPACGKKQNQAENQDMSVEGNLAYGQLPANAQIETLPPDESSGTSSGELNADEDNPDVNNLGNSH